MKKLMLMLFLGLFLISFVSAQEQELPEIGPYTLGENVTLQQTCNNCSSCNFTRVYNPDGEILLSNLQSVKDGTVYEFEVLGSNFTEIGKHSYSYACGNFAESKTGTINFKVTSTGEELNGSTVTVYLTLIGLLLFFIFMVVFAINKLPSKNTRDEENRLIQVNMMRHWRRPLWGVVYILVTGIMFIGANLSSAYLEAQFIGDILFAVFYILASTSIIWLIIMLLKIIEDVIHDKKLKRFQERGIDGM